MEGPDKRIQNEINRIELFKNKGKLPANWKYLGPETKDGIPNYKIFIFSWLGIEGDMKGGIYNAQIKIQQDLTTNAPKVYMLDSFEHMHVFGHGLVCFPFLDNFKWKPTISIIEIAQELEKMLNLPPDITSPANEKLKNLYNEDQAKYFKYLRDQAEKFKNKQPCLPY